MNFSYTTSALLSLSIFIAGIIALVRFNQIRSIYRPFIYLLWIGCFNESLGIYLALHGYYTITNGVIYALCESMFLLWFFKNLGVFKHNKYLLYSLVILFIFIWVAENIFKSGFGTHLSFYFDIFYSFCVVLLSFRVLNDLLFVERDLLKNPSFLISIGLIIFFTYEVIERLFWLYGLENSNTFLASVQSIMMIINLLTNLIYALAVLWMRKRQAFTLQF